MADEISITIDRSSISENGGTATGTIHRNTSAPLTVNLVSSDPSEATVPATISLPLAKIPRHL
ncbi:MAG: hypothetical protein R3C05_02875 [Pirellulaceae bacterium]